MVKYRKEDCIFYVNYKCGYSTFQNMCRAGIVEKYTGSSEGKITYIISRNPYERLESFYTDKLIRNMNRSMSQYCQRKLVEFFDNKSLINKKITFESFILNGIAKGYTDEHIELQSKILDVLPDYYIPLKELNKLNIILGVDTDKYRGNITPPHVRAMSKLVWTKEMRDIINKRYAEDFIRLDYDMM